MRPFAVLLLSIFFMHCEPGGAQVAVAVAPPGGGQTATIVVTGTTSTWMPCSQTSTLADRVYVMQVCYSISYVDTNGQNQTYSNCSFQSAGMTALSGNGFTFTFTVSLPNATAITGIAANALVQPTVIYGIHGGFTFDYVGSGSSMVSTVTVNVVRSGQTQCLNGLSNLYGLIGSYETAPGPQSVPVPPPVSPPPTCFFSYTKEGGSGILGLFSNATTFTQGDASSGCAAGGGQLPTAQQMLTQGPGLQLPSGCIWTQTQSSAGGYLVYIPGSGITSKPADDSCYAICAYNSCPQVAAPAVVAATAPAPAPANAAPVAQTFALASNAPVMAPLVPVSTVIEEAANAEEDFQTPTDTLVCSCSAPGNSLSPQITPTAVAQ